MMYIGILGSGGQANELESYLDSSKTEVAFRAISKDYLDVTDARQIDILNPSEKQRNIAVIAAIGAPLVRRRLIEEWPGDKYTSTISPSAYIGESSILGEGSIVAPNVVITTDVIIGKHVLVNAAVTVGHNCAIDDYVTISPGVHIGGAVKIGAGAFIGIGASIKNGVELASGVVVGAGAVVISDLLEENAVYVGVPAKKIGHNSDWLGKI